MPYSGNPATSPTDAVRFMVNDTSATPHFTDEEIGWLLAENDGDVRKAALGAAIRLRTKYALKADKSVGDLRITYSEMKSSMEGVIESLQAEVDGVVDETAGVPWMDGLEGLEPQKIFEIGMHDTFPQRPFDQKQLREGSPYAGE